MLRLVIAGLMIAIAGLQSAAAETKNVKDAIDVILLFCVAGGDKVEISGTGKVEGGLALKKFGASGEADINISKTEARGLVDGLRQEISKLGAEQASEARRCMQPYIDRILDLLIGRSSSVEPRPSSSAQFGDIFIAWPPSSAPCKLNFHIDVADQRVVPNAPLWRVSNVRLGPANWIIRGEVRCTNGSYCESPGNLQSGNVFLREGATYTFFWEMGPQYGGECRFSLRG